MKKRTELMRAINAKRKTLLDLLSAGSVDEAKKVGDELETLMSDLEKCEDDTPKASDGLKPISSGGIVKMDKKEQLAGIKRAVNKFLHGGWKALDEADRGLIKPVNATATPGQVETVTERGGVLVPVEVADFVARIDTGVYRLRTRVDNYAARSKSGVIPKLANPTSGLVQFFDELPGGGITRGDVRFGSVNYNVGDYGLIVPVSNDLMADANADVYGIIAEQFARAQVITEDSMILSAIDAAIAEPGTVTDWKDICKALNTTAPVGAADKVIVTNSDGYNYLDTLTDEQGRPILVTDLVTNPRHIFRGYEVIQLPNEVLPNVSGGIPFYVGSLWNAIYFIERKGMTIDYNPWSDSAYGRNAVDVRVVCRLDCKSKFPEAMQKLIYTPEKP